MGEKPKKSKEKKPVVNGGSITVQFGVHALKLSKTYAGKTVDELSNLVGDILNLPETRVAVINGKIVEDPETVKVKANDTIEFVKTAGKKG